MPAVVARAEIAASVLACARVPADVHVFIVAPAASRQSTGSRIWFGTSPTTTTLTENRFSDVAAPIVGLIDAPGSCVPERLPMIIVTAGRSVCALFLAQRYHVPHSPPVVHVRGMHATLTSGITAHPSWSAIWRIAGIHISACESPMTTIVLRAFATPSRQTLLVVSPRP